MKLTPLTISRMTLLIFIFSVLFSCSKDTDLLLDSVIYEPEVSLEVKNYTDIPAEEEGFVLRTYTFSPTYDAYIQNGQGYNYDIVRLQEDERTSYLMFDLSQIDGPITDAVLQFHVDSDEGDGDIRIHQGSTTDWTENNLNTNNAPQLVSEIAFINKTYLVGEAEKISLKTENLTSELTTLILSHQKGNDLAFASKENPNNRGPKLIITYKTEEDTPGIEQEEVQQIEEEVNTQPKIDSPPADYFVTTNGRSSNDGKTESTAWNIEYAFERALAGDVVYIKAGNYGNVELTTDNSGTVEKPIKFIGYKNTPGDIVSSNGSTFNYGDNLDASSMPLLEGSPVNGIGSGTAITVYEPYIFIENLQITRFEKGIFAKTHDGNFKNIIVTQMGDFNLSHSYPNGTSNAFLNYSGIGILVEGNRFELHNNFVLNCGAQGITFQNTNNSVGSYNAVYADDNVNPTDYYFLLGPGTLNSTFTNTKIFRIGSLSHLGHGIVLKGAEQITGNTFDGFEIVNTVLEPQFPNTANNIFKNGTITKEANVNQTTPSVGGINLANGAHDNYFENIILTNCSIKFQDWKDGLSGDVSDASDNNLFKRITVKDAFSAIAFAFFQVENHASSADGNIFEDCTFSNLEYLFEVDRANSGTLLKNSTISNVNILSVERIQGGPSYSLNASYEGCTWNSVNFTPPN